MRGINGVIKQYKEQKKIIKTNRYGYIMEDVRSAIYSSRLLRTPDPVLKGALDSKAYARIRASRNSFLGEFLWDSEGFSRTRSFEVPFEPKSASSKHLQRDFGEVCLEATPDETGLFAAAGY